MDNEIVFGGVIMLSTVCNTKIIATYDKRNIDAIFEFLSMLKDDYPDFSIWFFDKVVPDIELGLREILISEIDGEIAGASIIKKAEEKKICTLRVSPKYQRRGIGSHLLDVATHELTTKKPLITVSDTHFAEFIKLFSVNSFKLTEIHIDKYKKGATEMVFNGHLQ